MDRISFLLSKRFLTGLAICAGFFLLGTWPLPVTLTVALLAGLTYPSALRPLRSYKFWLAIGLLVIIVPLFAGIQDKQLLWFDYSSEKLAQTTLMALRGIIVFLLIQVLTADLDTEKFTEWLKRYGSSHFVTLYELSREIIPNARHILNEWTGRIKSGSIKNFRLSKVLGFFAHLFIELIALAERLDKPVRELADKDPVTVAAEINAMKVPVLLIITGNPGAGKTTWLKDLTVSLANQGTSYGGVVTVRKYNSEADWELAIQNISTGSHRLLASMEYRTDWVKTKNYYIDPTALEWGGKQLQLAQGNWLIVDEVGIFEFDRGGFYPALAKLTIEFKGVLVMSLRKSLLPDLDKFLSENLPGLVGWQRRMVILDEE